MRWLKKIALAITLTVIIGGYARAEQINNFDSNLVVQKSGQVNVTESINYDFGYAYRHGIYRYIPTIYKDDKGNQYRPKLKLDSVTADEQSTPYSTSYKDGNLVIKIGDANKTITGSHRYTISYHFETLLVDKDGDLLRFDVTGDGWSIPIDSATIKINGPGQPMLMCYTGKIGSTEQDCKVDEAAGVVTAQNVGDRQDFTVEALWPAGSVSNLLLPYKTPLWQVILIAGLVLYVLLGLGLMVAALARWVGIYFAERRAEKNQTIIAQYQPPANLTPGEIGFLSDNRASMVEITATIIQAAVKGVIRIEQVQEKSLFKSAQYKLIKLKSFDSLPADERPLFEAFFGTGKEINLKDVDRQVVPGKVTAYQAALKASLKAKEFYTKQSKFATALTTAGFIFLIIAIFTPLIFFIAFALTPLGLFMYKRAGQVPRRTASGLKTWAEVEGFKLFLSVTEKDRLAFSDAPKRTPKQFSAFLPYAIALGVEKEWAKQFEGIDITKSTNWYAGNTHAFTAGYLASSLNESFAPVIATSSSSPSSSSSGFGGGSSGGGFGGGGGGSW